MILPASKLAVNDREAVLDFWFPTGAGADLETHRRVLAVADARGGRQGDRPTLYGGHRTGRARRARRLGANPRGRLALVVVLDQFSRSVWADSPRAFAQDTKAVALVLEGHRSTANYDALETAWEKTFYIIPLGHCEGPGHLERLDLAIEARVRRARRRAGAPEADVRVQLRSSPSCTAR